MLKIQPNKIRKFHYYRYKLLSKITFGKLHKKYKEKYKALKLLLQKSKVTSKLDVIDAKLAAIAVKLDELAVIDAKLDKLVAIDTKLDKLVVIDAKVNSIYSELSQYICKQTTKVLISFPKESYETYWFNKFIEESKNLNYKESYQNLIKGLDEESIKTIDIILSRMANHLNPDKIFFTKEENTKILDLKANFKTRIVKLDEECFAYNGYYLPINHFETCVFYYHHEIPNLKTDISNKDIIDAGAFIGDSAIVFSRYTSKNVYSFEPSNNNFKNLLKTIQLNNAKNIVAENKGLGAKKEVRTLIGDGSASSSYYNQFNKEVCQEIEIISLDEYVAEVADIDIGLIKTDLEGYELEFLRGAEKTIKKFKPALVISIYHSAYDFFQVKPLIESWNLGYNFRVVKPVDGQILLETVLIAEIE